MNTETEQLLSVLRISLKRAVMNTNLCCILRYRLTGEYHSSEGTYCLQLQTVRSTDTLIRTYQTIQRRFEFTQLLESRIVFLLWKQYSTDIVRAHSTHRFISN
jgi:hypothetical protein